MALARSLFCLRVSLCRARFFLWEAVTAGCNLNSRAADEMLFFQRLGQSADLIHLDKNRISDVGFDAALKSGLVCHEDIVTHDLNLFSQRGRHHLPSLPIILSKRVLDRYDRILPYPIFVEPDHLVSTPLTAVRLFEDISAVFVTPAGSDIDG